MIINRPNLDAIFTGFKANFQSAFDGVKTQYKDIAMVVPSTTAKEIYPWLGAMPNFREWLGDRVINNLRTHDFSLINRDYENTVGVQRNAIEDDTFGTYAPIFAEYGRASASLPDELVFQTLPLGTSQLCYDGQFFFDTDHPVLNADGTVASVSNFGGGGGNAWYLMDLSRAVKPMIFQDRKKFELVRMDDPKDENVFMRKEYLYGVDGRCAAGFGLWQLAYMSRQTLNAANYAAARAAMLDLKGDGGRKLGVNPTHLVVGGANEGPARKILMNEMAAGGESNEWKGTAQLLLSSYL